MTSQTLLEFARGPALQWSVAIFLFGLSWRLVGIFFLRTRGDLSAPRNPKARSLPRQAWHAGLDNDDGGASARRVFQGREWTWQQ